MIKLVWGVIGLVAVIMMWVGMFESLWGKYVSYLLLSSVILVILTDRSRCSPMRSKRKLIAYGLAALVSGVLLVSEFRDHKYACAGEYHTNVNTSGHFTENPFSQTIVCVNERNIADVCSFPGTQSACLEYKNCLSNPFYSIYLFLYISSLCVASSLLYRELRKNKEIGGYKEFSGSSGSSTLSPKQKAASDLLKTIRARAPKITVAELAAITGKSERAIRAYLQRHEIKAKDYDWANKKSKG